MSREATCGTCGGSGKVTVYEPWENALHMNASMVEFAESQPDEWSVVSLDVEGSYPMAVLGRRGEHILTSIEQTIQHWPLRGDDHPTSPRNIVNGAFYEPIDPRFYA